MGKTAEEAMVLAAMENDQETLERLARESTPTERSHLAKALNRVYEALLAAGRQGGDSNGVHEARP